MTSNDTTIQELAADLQAKIDELAKYINMLWVMKTFMVIITMQAGFSILEFGFTRRKNSANIMMKNLADFAFGGMAFYMFGWGVAFAKGNGFTGKEDFFLSNDERYDEFLFQLAFATTTVTIVSGALIERVRYPIYCFLSFITASLIYPFVAHWVWSTTGWLSPSNPSRSLGTFGYIDFAGDGPIHLCGGTIATVANIIIGARAGRWDKDAKGFNNCSPYHVIYGTFILWFGWYGFNCGSTLGLTGGRAIIAARVGVTTTVSACAGTMMSLVLSFFFYKGHFDVGETVNGALAGLVGITASCAVADTWASIFIGTSSSIVCCLLYRLVVRLKIDDPIGVTAVHFGCGTWGIICVGLFAKEEYTKQVYGHPGASSGWGLFYGGGFELLGIQLLGWLCIFTWTVGLSAVVIFFLKRFLHFRVPYRHEMMGLDATEHNRATAELDSAMEMMRALDDSRQQELEKIIQEQNTKKLGEVLPTRNANKLSVFVSSTKTTKLETELTLREIN